MERAPAFRKQPGTIKSKLTQRYMARPIPILSRIWNGKSGCITIVQSANTALSVGKNQKSLGIQHPTFQELIPGHANVVASRKQGDILKVHIAFCMTPEATESSLNARSNPKSHKAKPTEATIYTIFTIQSRK